MQYRFKLTQVTKIIAVSFLLLGFTLAGDGLAKSKKGWLGVSIQEMTPSMRQDYDLGSRSGLLITSVVSGSPADDAGLREDDVILKYNGQSVELSDDFSKTVRQTEPGSEVKVLVMRSGEEREFTVTIERSRSHRARIYSMADNMTFFFGRPQLGVSVHELNADLAPYFKVEEQGGVLVSEVFEDTPADEAGLKAGDVITMLDGERVSEPLELIDLLRDYEDGDVVKVTYVRLGKKAEVEVELEEAEHDFRFNTNFAPEFDFHRMRDRHEIRRAPRIEIRSLHDRHNSI